MSTSSPSRLPLNITALPIASSVLNPHRRCISCLPAPQQRHSHLDRPGPGLGVARGSWFPWRQRAHPCPPPTPAGAVGAEPLPCFQQVPIQHSQCMLRGGGFQLTVLSLACRPWRSPGPVGCLVPCPATSANLGLQALPLGGQQNFHLSCADASPPMP